AEASGLASGGITVFSHSIRLDPDCREEMKHVAEKIAAKGPHYDPDLACEDYDPHGYVQIRVEGSEVVVTHLYKGHELNEYRGHDPKELRRALAVDQVISDIDHALYIGMELRKAFEALKKGEDYQQN
ncbi:MAG: DUF4346 domain-containing protein, partial [Deltaproteobacteria bacterium]|nr:DUF4346 domain-containing protein [Deltaproteobacteria bacterium]